MCNKYGTVISMVFALLIYDTEAAHYCTSSCEAELVTVSKDRAGHATDSLADSFKELEASH